MIENKPEHQRFINDFSSLFNNELNKDEILKVRNTFNISRFDEYISLLSHPERKNIFEKVFKFTLSETIPKLGIIPQRISGHFHDNVAIAKLSCDDDIAYLCIGDAIKFEDSIIDDSDFTISIKSYTEDAMFTTQLVDILNWGGGNYIDYDFFNCLSLTVDTEWVTPNDGVDSVYKFDTLTFNIKQDQKFEMVGMKDFHGNELFDKDEVIIQFKGEDKYKVHLDFSKDMNKCLVYTQQLGRFVDILALNIWSNIIHLERI